MKLCKPFFIISLVFLLFLLVGCGGGTSSSKFNPPAWIQGTWGDDFGTYNYTFTSDNIISFSTGFSMDYKVMYANVPVSESSSSNSYVVTVASINTYSFTKITSNSLNYSVTSSGMTIGPYVLNKK